jgi:hypothetical protein
MAQIFRALIPYSMHVWAHRILCSKILSARSNSRHRCYSLPRSMEMPIYITLLLFPCFHVHFELPYETCNPGMLHSLVSFSTRYPNEIPYHLTACLMFSSRLSFCTDNSMSAGTLPESASAVSSRRRPHRLPGLSIPTGKKISLIYAS